MEGENSTYLYRECLRNHAANLGSYATDGCGEFTLDDTAPGAANLQCAACGCHRNFHRKINYLIGRAGGGSSCTRGRDGDTDTAATELADYAVVEYMAADTERSSGKMKRYRTKFTADQKEKMLEFAEKLGWKLQRRDLDDEIERFCKSVGVSRQVFKVWMHNHKNSFSSNSTSNGNASSLTQS